MEGLNSRGRHTQRPLTIWLTGYSKRDVAGADHLMEETGSSCSR
jgi:hypothetical protein